FEYLVAAIVDRDRIDPCAGMFFEIHSAQVPAVGFHEAVDLVRDITFIESVASLFADQPQGVRQRWIFKNVSLHRGAAFAIERVSFEKGTGKSLVEAWPKRPVISNKVGDGKTFLGITNRWREVVAQFELAEFLVQLRPGVNCARDADWQHTG